MLAYAGLDQARDGRGFLRNQTDVGRERERAGESASMRSSMIFPIERPQQQLFGCIAEIKGNFILNFYYNHACEGR